MDIRPIRTEADYKATLKAVSPYFDQEPAPGTEDADRFEVLLALIQSYESKNHPIDPPDAIEAIKFEWSSRASRRRILSLSSGS